jgi:tetratricopeptide (TPR) repeat protein
MLQKKKMKLLSRLNDRRISLSLKAIILVAFSILSLSFLLPVSDSAPPRRGRLVERGKNPRIRWRPARPIGAPTPTQGSSRNHYRADSDVAVPRVLARAAVPWPSPSPLPDKSPVPLDKVEELLLQGNMARDAGSYEEANSKYQEALSLRANEWRAYYGLGNVFFDRATETDAINRPLMASAVKEYEEAVKYSTSDKQAEGAELAELHSDLAQAYLWSKVDGWLDKAKGEVAAAIHLNPESASAYRRLGNISYADGNYDDAIINYNKSLDFEDNALTHQGLGAAYIKKEKYDDAIREFRQVVSLRPDYAEGFENVGKLYFDTLRKYPDSIEWFKQAVTLKPNLVTARYKLSLAYYFSGKQEEAMRAYEDLKRYDKKQAEVLFSQIKSPFKQP